MIGYFAVIIELITQVQYSDTPRLSSSMIIWIIVAVVLWLASLGWNIYNRWIVGGRTGQSVGKRVTKIALISETTGHPIGAGNAFLRDIVHILDGAAYIGYLWPLWDEKRQTFADKLMRTIVVDRAPESEPTAPRQSTWT